MKKIKLHNKIVKEEANYENRILKDKIDQISKSLDILNSITQLWQDFIDITDDQLSDLVFKNEENKTK